jgi:hypothetical protein
MECLIANRENASFGAALFTCSGCACGAHPKCGMVSNMLYDRPHSSRGGRQEGRRRLTAGETTPFVLHAALPPILVTE